MTVDAPQVMSEHWLPMAELGIESRRERAAASALPPLSFLHVWWARRPLVASAGVVLAGLLPAWTPELAVAFPGVKHVASEQHDPRVAEIPDGNLG
jgi:adenine-specific DNA methylase